MDYEVIIDAAALYTWKGKANSPQEAKEKAMESFKKVNHGDLVIADAAVCGISHYEK